MYLETVSKQKIKEINQFVEGQTLGERMKKYEGLSKGYLNKNLPFIIRIDGKAFHTFTRGFDKPFDKWLREAMELTALELAKNIQGAAVTYHQSDEISILVTNYKLSNNVSSEPWFGNNISKIVSITASMATLYFNRFFARKVEESIAGCEGMERFELDRKPFDARRKSLSIGALFDSRVFNIPVDEVNNYFIWRQQDAIKNSISMVSQAIFSHKSLHGLNGLQKIEKINEAIHGKYDEYFSVSERRGSCSVKVEETFINNENKEFVRSKWITDNNIPVFKDDKEYINRVL